ncbi:hypothetical protein BS47DRAFT_537235 [Hydnum rufescens UP504]|uniref:Uncharacterized protein n=1 Tax=Hydnum rufescens UP504 TaxID=1448309 RepID=A0A9P6AGS9_9AGAM|nr:hypothetical protein BS47DRAFT_537235 [Hydnum rufescens UP504]
MMPIGERYYVRVDSDAQSLRDWRKHTSLPTHPNQLSPDDLYVASRHVLMGARARLLSRGWREVGTRWGELWCLAPPGSPLEAVEEEVVEGEGVAGSSTYATNPAVSSPDVVFAVPSDLRSMATYGWRWASIFTDQRLLQARMDAVHGLVLHSSADPVLVDVIYLMQLCLPGWITVVKERHDPRVFSTRESRPFPPLAWMMGQASTLQPIFGYVYWSVLAMRSRDVLSRIDFLD